MQERLSSKAIMLSLKKLCDIIKAGVSILNVFATFAAYQTLIIT